jgi:hypothetical protein
MRIRRVVCRQCGAKDRGSFCSACGSELYSDASPALTLTKDAIDWGKIQETAFLFWAIARSPTKTVVNLSLDPHSKAHRTLFALALTIAASTSIVFPTINRELIGPAFDLPGVHQAIVVFVLLISLVLPARPSFVAIGWMWGNRLHRDHHQWLRYLVISTSVMYSIATLGSLLKPYQQTHMAIDIFLLFLVGYLLYTLFGSLKRFWGVSLIKAIVTLAVLTVAQMIAVVLVVAVGMGVAAVAYVAMGWPL